MLDIVLYTEGLRFNGATLENRSLGGAETAFISVARELAALNHRVLAFCPCDQPGSYDGVIYRDSTEFAAWCEEGQCDLFICSRFYEVLSLNVPAITKILWSHDTYLPEQYQRLEQFMPRITAVYCLSDYHQWHFRQHLPHWDHKIRRTHNGLDFSLIKEAVASESKRHKLMYTSRPERGLLRALSIYEQYADRTLEFTCCTYDYPWKGQDIGMIEAMCDYKIADLKAQGFPITSGTFSKRELYRHLAQSKAVIYPAEIAEITPISALEAQACGAVYLAPDHSGFQEFVPYRRLDIQQPEQWTAFLRDVLNDDIVREQLAEQGRQHIRPYSWSSVAEEFANTGFAEASGIVHINRVAPLTAVTIGGAQPKISCVMPTRNRIVLAKEAIRCFLNQSYPNRELIIVAGGSTHSQRALSSYVSELDRTDIKCVLLGDEDASLGRMRNMTLDAAGGDIICQWDDDDLYHGERLQVQAAAMTKVGAYSCFLTDHFQYFTNERTLYWIDWSHGGVVGGKDAQLPGSVMMMNDPHLRYPETGDGSMIGEDCVMQDALCNRFRSVNLSDYGYIYVYRYHARNTCSKEHHQKLSKYATNSEFVVKNIPKILESLKYYALPKPIAVRCRDDQVIISYNE
ncbi:MAG: glycosyltransferase [Oceanibaculum nanhaiense]|jgi:glycosyltransferase involved in cell wall biosynthesis|uniref:glycosyltransferase n=1 Tax=Oceanibaculum nanhaiense TaxID=1909734 RepID=UPI0032EBE98A